MTESLLPTSAAADLPRAPYPGLRPFQEKDASIFFGRRRQYVRMLNILKREHFVARHAGIARAREQCEEREAPRLSGRTAHRTSVSEDGQAT